MLEQTARVVKASNSTLWVETQSRSACSHCASSSCTTSVISKLFGVRRNRLQMENSLGAKVGQQVVIGIPDDLLVRASVWAYLLPLVVMLFATALGSALGMSEGFQSLLALSGLVVGFFFVRWASRRLSSQEKFKPQLLRIVRHGEVQAISLKGHLLVFRKVKTTAFRRLDLSPPFGVYNRSFVWGTPWTIVLGVIRYSILSIILFGSRSTGTTY